MVTARATGKRVEDLSQRTETTQVFANPEGTWTSEAASGPVRVSDDAGSWHDIDTTLVERDGHLEPQYAASDVRFSDGGDNVFASLSEDGKDLSWKWPTTLPAPQVDGDTATYVGAVEGGDLVVTATATGFSHSVVLRTRPASLDALAADLATDQPDSTDGSASGLESGDPSAAPLFDPAPSEAPAVTDPVQFSMPIATDGAKLSQTATGAVQVATKAGDVVAAAPKPLMWDAQTNAEGDPSNVVPVAITVTPAGATTPDGATAGANPVLTLTPDQDFLADPDTQYPVTIDPSFTTNANGDTWIEGGGSFPTSQAGSEDLKVGTYDGGTHVARSYLTFSSSAFSGKHIVKANLWMRNYQSNSCSAANIWVQRITASWSVTGLTWAAQPAATQTGQGLFSTAYGSGGCPADGAHWDVTSIVDGWASGAYTNYGLAVRAQTETANATRRFYRSVNYSDTAVQPRLVVTYNHAPSVPTQPVIGAAATYAPPGSSTSANYVATKRPTFTATTTDPDGGAPATTFYVYNATTNAYVTYCQVAAASGAKASCTLGTDLADGAYSVYAIGWDGYDYSGGVRLTGAQAKQSAPSLFTVAATTPAAPVVSCPGYADGSWTTTPPPGGSVTCTVSAAGAGPSAPGSIEYSLDQHSPVTKAIAQDSDPTKAKIEVRVSTTDGGHGINATAVSPSGLKSSANDYGFGWGQVGLSLPFPDQVETTTDTVALEASGPESGDGTSNVTASVKWRVAGTTLDEDHGWNEDTATHLTVSNSASGVHVTGTWNTQHAVTDAASTPSGADPITLNKDRPVVLDIQVCIDYPGTQVDAHCTWASKTSRRQVLRVAHAFGGNFPTADVPGGQVALFTGELAVGNSDATVGASGADLSVSRTASSFAGPVANPASQVFGPGWNASLDGPGDGLGDMTLVDNTLVDGTLQLVDGVGSAMIFGASAAPARRTTASLTQGDWVALDQDTDLSATKLKVEANGSVTVTEDGGTATNFGVTTAPTLTTAGVYTVDVIDEAQADGVTKYSRDDQGRITQILAPTPPGVDCSTGMVDGCRAMTINYTPVNGTTAAPGITGDVEGQVKEIDQVIGNGTPTPLATYKYDNSHRLVAATDALTGLVTAYTYDGSTDRIASVAPAGLAKISYTYDADSHKLVRVKRPRPEGGTANLATVVYDVPTHGHTGLPDLGGADVAVWGQAQTPAHAAAVFGPDQPLDTDQSGDTVDTATVSAVDHAASSGAAWRDADLSYFDADGRTTNSAEFGAGQWLLTSATYDDQNNVVRRLDESDIAAIQAGDLPRSQAGNITVYNGDEPGLPAGSVVYDTYATARLIRNAAGTMVWASPHRHITYDQGAPNGGINPDTGQRYALPTTVTSDAVAPTTGIVVDTYGTTTTSYDNAILGGTAADGWRMGLPGDTTAVMSGSPGTAQTDVVSRSRYDATGRVVETRLPKSSGADAGTRRTLYYTAAEQAGTPCGGKLAWAGAVCQTTYAGTASGPNAALVTTTITSYDDQLSPLVIEESANGATRTTTKTYIGDGQPLTTSVATTGLAGSSQASTGTGKTTTQYDQATGLPATVTTEAAGGNPGGVVTTGYDSWGRETGYTITNNGSSPETTTTVYNADGDVASVTDPKGTTNYTYDGTDAASKEEHRGLATKVSVSRDTGGTLDFTGAYGVSGAPVQQDLPGGLIQRFTYDSAGEPTGLSYSGPVAITDPDTGDVTGTNPDAAWVGWSQDNDAQGRVRREWTPTGGGLTGDLTGAAATGFARDYTYDYASRLVTVKDQTLTSGAGTTTEGDAGITGIATAVCQVRSYAYDTNGNRTSKTTTTGTAGAACPTSGGTTTPWAHDAADRITNAGYVYDQLGRQTSIPQTDSPMASAGGSPGAVTLSYFDGGAVKSIAQSGTTTSFALDAAGRRGLVTTTPSAGAATATTQHYKDRSDNPAWSSTVTGTSAPIVERYVQDLTGYLGVTIAPTQTTITVVDLQGSVVGSIDLPSSGAPAGLSAWMSTDEYGNSSASSIGKTPTNTEGISDGIGYGWLGAAQRSADNSGLLLVGARVYNPTTGQFTSTDPLVGGNTTAYAYPQDPVNIADVSGNSAKAPEGGAATPCKCTKSNTHWLEMTRWYEYGAWGKPPGARVLAKLLSTLGFEIFDVDDVGMQFRTVTVDEAKCVPNKKGSKEGHVVHRLVEHGAFGDKNHRAQYRFRFWIRGPFAKLDKHVVTPWEDWLS